MDTPDAPDQSRGSGSVEPLKSKRLNGESYQRFAVVELEIAEFNRMTESERAAGFKRARPETVMHFARKRGRVHEAMTRLLFKEAGKRICNAVHRRAAGQPKIVVEQVIMEVELDIMELLLSGAQDRKADYLEVHFYGAIEGRVLDALRSHERSPMGGRRGWIHTEETDEDGDLIENTIELVPADGPDPQAILLATADQKLVERATQLARDEVEDPRQLEAVHLHYFEDWPVTSKDPGVTSLEAYFGERAWVIRYWMSSTLKVLYRILTALKTGEVL